VRVLVVEDHAKLAMTVATGLRQAAMAVDLAFDGRDALDHVAITSYVDRSRRMAMPRGPRPWPRTVNPARE